MKILVLGASGQLGDALLRAARAPGASPRIEMIGLARPAFDLARPADVDALAADADHVDLVVNAAAYTAVDKAESEPAAAYAVNAAGPGRLAAGLAARGVPLIHVSTDYVFDGAKPAPYVEDDPINPLNVYGASKAAGEAAVRAANPRHLILRTSWVYGPTGANFVKTMRRLGREREELGIVADQRGAPTAAADLAAVILALASATADRRGADQQGLWGTLHVAGTGETTWFDFAMRIFDHMARTEGRRPALRPLSAAEYPTPARRPANSRLDCARLRAVFGLATPPWEESLERTLDALDALEGLATPPGCLTEKNR